MVDGSIGCASWVSDPMSSPDGEVGLLCQRGKPQKGGEGQIYSDDLSMENREKLRNVLTNL